METVTIIKVILIVISANYQLAAMQEFDSPKACLAAKAVAKDALWLGTITCVNKLTGEEIK